MNATLIPTALPRYLCEEDHESYGHDLTHCQHGLCGLPLTRVTVDGRRWAPRSKRG